MKLHHTTKTADHVFEGLIQLHRRLAPSFSHEKKDQTNGSPLAFRRGCMRKTFTARAVEHKQSEAKFKFNSDESMS